MKKIIFCICCLLVADDGWADMYAALNDVYMSNPLIKQARADVDLAQANLDSAKTELQPYLGLSGNVGLAQTQLAGMDFDYAPMQYGIEVQQNIFSGGAMFAKIKAGHGLAHAAQAQLYAVQQDVFMAAINAYIEVLNAREVMDLNENNQNVLQKYYDLVRDRMRVGMLTQTDVAQASARLEMAKYGVSDAVAKYDNALETFRRIYGRVDYKFADIDLDKIDGLFPESVSDAEEDALRNHPVLRALHAQEDATRQNITVARSSMVPSVDVRGAINRVDNVPFLDDITDSRIGVYLKVPLYDKGNAFANMDKVRANIAGIQEQVINTRRVIIENLRSAWNIYQAQEYAITATMASVDASKLALDGVRDEQARGRRTVLDVLNAEQELLNARVAHVRAKHARISAFFAVLSAMGELSPENLGLEIYKK